MVTNSSPATCGTVAVATVTVPAVPPKMPSEPWPQPLALLPAALVQLVVLPAPSHVPAPPCTADPPAVVVLPFHHRPAATARFT